ncbi:hypothetical protein B7494_g5382 [Chlorociboria aeruginascens]|nr:hypothetical protein B7494_g5382 [Chlorociboria aeruginascens]
MTSATAGTIDMNAPGKYPVVLSDALLGKTSKEVYTAVRYNHKPDPSSDTLNNSLHLRPSTSDPSNFDLSLKDNSEEYSYTGARTTGDGQYVLIFDPAKKHFVLHRIDSTFDMNLTHAPWSDDTSALREQYPQLETTITSRPSTTQKKISKAAPKAVAAPKATIKRTKVEKAKKKPPPREPTPSEEDSDDGLTIEYPDALSHSNSQPFHSQNTYQSTPTFHRDVSEEISEEDSDAEHEVYEDEKNQDVDHLQLPSPARNNDAMSEEDMDMELDLEAELEQALKETEERADESSESEEE